MTSVTNDIDVNGKNIAIASAVTSLARMKLYELMKDIRDAGCTILYSDTDSIITDCKLNSFPEL